MTVKATQFRKNLFQILDELNSTGQTLVIERGYERYLLKAQAPKIPLDQARSRPWVLKNPAGIESFSPSDWTADDLS